MNILNQIAGISEMAELWGLSESRIKYLCQNGEIEAKKIGKTWVIDKNQDNPKKYNVGVDVMKIVENVLVTKRKHFDHIIGEEFEDKEVTENELYNILAESEEFSDEDEIVDVKANKSGTYSLSNGDFDYYIEVK